MELVKELEILKACELLGCVYPHSKEKLRQVFNNKVLKNHPDKGGKQEDFIQLHAAYELLKANIPTILGHDLVVQYQQAITE